MAYLFNQTQLKAQPIFKKVKRMVDPKIQQCKSFCVVGWRYDSSTNIFPLLHQYGKIHLVETFYLNIQDFKKKGFDYVNTINDDIQNYKQLFKKNEIDCLIWQNGPEHLDKESGMSILKLLPNWFDLVIVESISKPEDHSLGMIFGNPYENRLSEWTIEDYKQLKYKTIDYNYGIFAMKTNLKAISDASN